MTETTRIRWDDKTPGNGDACNVAHIGYVGTIEESAFIIYTPDDSHDDWLLSVRLVPGSQFLYADSAGELKAVAERWLSGFAASLGAIFPAELCEVVTKERARRDEAAGSAPNYEMQNRYWGWTDALDWVLALMDRAAPSGAGKE